MTQGSNAPATPLPPAPAIAGADVQAAPTTRALTSEDIIALRARRSELSNQLTSAAGRRRTLASELNSTADPAARAGLESRIAVLDRRMVQLEGDIAQTGQVLSSDAAARVAVTEQANNFMGIDPNVGAPLLGAFMFLVLMPIAVGVGRMFWKRGNHPPAAALPPIVTQSAERLSRLEQSVDAIAVEIERISEGQRFVTKLLAEKAPALPAQAEAGAGANEQLKETVQFRRG